MSEKRQFFGTDGVRAVANRHPMTPEFVMRLAQAAAVVLGGKVGGRGASEGRPGPRHPCLGRNAGVGARRRAQFRRSGCHSRRPTAHAGRRHAQRAARRSFGVIVSASHNPFKDNGVKFVHGDGHKLNDKTEIAIEKPRARQ
jgi:phosphoglucosamine mutase